MERSNPAGRAEWPPRRVSGDSVATSGHVRGRAFALTLTTVIPVACPQSRIDVIARSPVGVPSRSSSTLMRIASRLRRTPETAPAGGQESLPGVAVELVL